MSHKSIKLAAAIVNRGARGGAAAMIIYNHEILWLSGDAQAQPAQQSWGTMSWTG